MINPLLTWQSSFDAIPVDPTGALWPTNITNWILTNSLLLTLDPSVVMGVPPGAFTWSSAVFKSGISSMVPTPDPVTPPTTFATAWNASITPSVLVVPSGASVGAPTPATIFSAPPLVTVNAAALALAFSGLTADLQAALPAAKGAISDYPPGFFDAFSALKYDLIGLNSIPPPAGPLPLVAMAVPVV